MTLQLTEVRRLDAILGELLKIEPEVDALISRPWIGRYLRRVGVSLGWADMYELTFAEQLAVLLFASGQAEIFLPLLKEGKSLGPVLDYAEQFESGNSDFKPKRWRVVVCLLALKALLRNVACVSYYSKSMGDLVRLGVAGEHLALRRAVAVDPTILASPLVASRVASLVVQGRSRELKAIYSSAVKGPNRQLDPYRRLRYLERVMREGNVFAAYGREDVFRFITEDVRLYDGRRGDPFKGLFTLFDRWNKEAIT